jgi:hypothetical protein
MTTTNDLFTSAQAGLDIVKRQAEVNNDSQSHYAAKYIEEALTELRQRVEALEALSDAVHRYEVEGLIDDAEESMYAINKKLRNHD